MSEEFEFLSPEKAVLAEQLCEEQADLNAEITRLEYKRQEWLSKPEGSDKDERFREVTVRIIEGWMWDLEIDRRENQRRLYELCS